MPSVAEILTELEGFYAYENGATDSGVKDDSRRAELVNIWRTALQAKSYRIDEARWFREMFLSEEAIAQGSGVRAVTDFFKWLENDT